VLGEDHEETAPTYNDLGCAFCEQGELEEAMDMCQKALDIQLKILGEEHEDAAHMFHSISEVHYKQGNLGEAAELCQKALAIGLKILEQNDPFIDEANELMEKIQMDATSQTMEAKFSLMDKNPMQMSGS